MARTPDRETYIVFLKPWSAVTPDSSSARFFEDELARELGSNHPLYGRHASCVAKNQTCDDFLFLIDDNTVAQVHLTYMKYPPERPGWPSYTLFETFTEWMIDSMIQDHRHHLLLW